MGDTRSTRVPAGTDRVSVVLATFNGDRYLEAQLRSLSAQERLPDEVVVVDDASTDRTVAILEQWAAEAPFTVDLVARSEHLGTAATFEEGLRRATGDILMFCDQDDRWTPDKVGVMAAALEPRPDALLAFSDCRLIDADDRVIGPSRWRVAGFGDRQARAMADDPFGQMLSRQIVSGCTSALRAELVPALVPFPSGLHPTMGDMIYDRWTSLVAAAAGPVLPVPDRLVDYRIHPGQQLGIPALWIRRVAPRTMLHLGQFVTDRAEKVQRAEFHLLHLEEIQKRLVVAGLESDTSREQLRLAERHFAWRGALDPARSRRARSVLREVRGSNDYRRYALGAASAVSDVVR